jgi:predicted nucleotidyltransferase
MPHGSSSDSVTITFLDVVGLLERLRAIVDRILRESRHVKEIRVAGSVARGDHTGDSDLDLLVILRGKPPGDRLEHIRDLYRYFDLPVGVDLFVCGEAPSRRVP